MNNQKFLDKNNALGQKTPKVIMLFYHISNSYFTSKNGKITIAFMKKTYF